MRGTVAALDHRLRLSYLRRRKRRTATKSLATEIFSTFETKWDSSLVYLGGAVDDFLWSVDVRSCGKLPNFGFAANEALRMRYMRCV